MKKEIYLGYGCAHATIEGEQIIVKCWRTTTSIVVSNLYCDLIKGAMNLTPEIMEDEFTDTWEANITPNTYFVLDIQGQNEVIYYWSGENIFEVASAWLGGGEKNFSVNWKGNTWNNDIKRKKNKIFKNIITSIDWYSVWDKL